MKFNMEIVAKIKKTLGLNTTYKLWKKTRDRGVDVSINGVSNYDKKPCSSMRLDILMTWQEMCAEKGISLETFWGWLKKDIKDLR